MLPKASEGLVFLRHQEMGLGRSMWCLLIHQLVKYRWNSKHAAGSEPLIYKFLYIPLGKSVNQLVLNATLWEQGNIQVFTKCYVIQMDKSESMRGGVNPGDLLFVQVGR